MPSEFSSQVIAWQKAFGRHDLPWQNTRDPYALWVSEIMLQQTQVATVIPYYARFMARFPSLSALAGAAEQDVLAVWSGLGYYARGRNLHRAAKAIREKHAGSFPNELPTVMDLPGIGRSTAAAICVFAFGQRHAILDGNVKRVLARYFGVHGYPGERHVEDQLWALSNSLLPSLGIEAYTQGLMDLGASVCTRSRPACARCPLAGECVAKREQLADKLPAPKPRKERPHRRTKMLILWDGHEVLLERRPPAGIWGGLWCFPEGGQPIEECVAACAGRFAVECERILPLAFVEHGFTHFKLTIEPYLLRVSRKASGATEPGALWLPIQEASASALPAPVRELLVSLVTSGYCPAENPVFGR
jgi:A/G-specific adenine glycosylase